jgi:hypothetical protein
MRQLWYTGYLVSSLTFLSLAYLDWQIPGMVSAIFPVYSILLLAIICGVVTVWLPVDTERAQASVGWRRFTNLIAILVGCVVALTMFKTGQVFAGYRLVITLVLVALPFVLLSALRQVKT